MQRRIWKNLLTFVLVLILTVGTVAALSMATAAKTETAPARYSQQIQEARAPSATELSAAIPENTLSPVVSVGAFTMILAIPGIGSFLFLRFRRKGRIPEKKPGRRYSPRADMAFHRM